MRRRSLTRRTVLRGAGGIAMALPFLDAMSAAGQTPSFEAIDTDQSDSAKLDALVNALNSIKVPNEDRIEIIKEIARSGKLHGRLIVE